MKKLFLIYIIFLIVSEILIFQSNSQKLLIVDYGPKNIFLHTQKNNFNKIETIWIKTNRIVSENSYIIWNNKKIKVTTSKKEPIVSLSIDESFYGKKGNINLQLVDAKYNIFSNIFQLIIR